VRHGLQATHDDLYDVSREDLSDLYTWRHLGRLQRLGQPTDEMMLGKHQDMNIELGLMDGVLKITRCTSNTFCRRQSLIGSKTAVYTAPTRRRCYSEYAMPCID